MFQNTALWTIMLKRTIPHPLQENFSPSRGIPQDEEKWGETLTGFENGGPYSTPLQKSFSPSRGIYRLKLLIKIIFHCDLKKSSFSWDLVGSHEMGRSSPGGGRVRYTIFKSHESFSPFLLISWDSFCPDPTPSMRSSLHLVGFTD